MEACELGVDTVVQGSIYLSLVSFSVEGKYTGDVTYTKAIDIGGGGQHLYTPQLWLTFTLLTYFKNYPTWPKPGILNLPNDKTL